DVALLGQVAVGAGVPDLAQQAAVRLADEGGGQPVRAVGGNRDLSFGDTVRAVLEGAGDLEGAGVGDAEGHLVVAAATVGAKVARTSPDDCTLTPVIGIQLALTAPWSTCRCTP